MHSLHASENSAAVISYCNIPAASAQPQKATTVVVRVATAAI